MFTRSGIYIQTVFQHQSVVVFVVSQLTSIQDFVFNPLNAELNTICHLLALLGAHHILHVSRIRVKYWWHQIKGTFLV